MRKILIALLVLAFVVLIAVGCTTARGTKFIISFNSNGGTDVGNIVLDAGDSLTLPPPPTKEGYVFLGWFNDSECTRPLLLDRFHATSNMTLFAGWESVETYPHLITIAPAEGGTVTLSMPDITDSRAPMGTEIRLKVTPLSGFECISVTAVGKTQNISVPGVDGIYVFSMPAEPVTVYAVFDYASKNITVSDSTVNGTVLLSQDTARFGDTVSFSFIPDYGYRSIGAEVSYVVNGITTPVEVKNGSFTMPNANVVVTGLFEAIDYSTKFEINVVKSEGGEIVVGKDSAAAGEYIYYYVVPDEGFLLTGVYVNCGDRSEISHDGFFVMPEGDVTMTASFVPDGFVNIDRYELEFADSDGMGTVQTVSDKTQFAAGEKVVLNITPAAGYMAQGIVVNGTYFENIGDEYYFFMPPSKAFVSVDFRFTGYPITVTGDENTKVSLSDDRGIQGEVIKFSVSPYDGYAVRISVYSGNDQIPFTATDIFEFMFVMPEAEVCIDVDTYPAEDRSVTVETVGNGDIIVSNTAKCGEAVKIDYTSVSGYDLRSVEVTANGESVQVFDNAFVMPDSDVTITAEFGAIYYLNGYDDQNLTITPSEYVAFDGDTVYFDIDVHGFRKNNSVVTASQIDPYTVQFSLEVVSSEGNVTLEEITYSGEDTSVTLNLSEAATPGSTIMVAYNGQSNNILNLSTAKISYSAATEGGTVSANYNSESNVPVNSEVMLTIVPDDGYKLSRLVFKNLTDGEEYEGRALFRMPDYDLQIVAEFSAEQTLPVTPEEIYTKRKDEFIAAGFDIELSRSAAELSEEWKGYTLSGYLRGAVSVKSDIAFDFYLLYVDSLSTVAPVSQTSGTLLHKIYPEAELDCYIHYNTIVFALNGDAETGYQMLKYGIISDGNFIYYRRGDQTLGVLSYIGNSPYISIPDSANGCRVAFINRFAFAGNEYIKTIDFGAVTEIDDYAFDGATGVRYFDLGFVTEIGVGAFKNTRARRFDVAAGNRYFEVDEYGVLYRLTVLSNRILEAYPAAAENTSYTLHAHTTGIADYAFYGVENLLTFRYLGSLTAIGDYAFCNALKLERIIHSADSTSDKIADFSDSVCNVETIGAGAFKGTAVSSFDLGIIKYIGSEAIVFDGTHNVTVFLNHSELIAAADEPVAVTAPSDTEYTLSLYGGNLTEQYKSSAAFAYLSQYFVE